MIFFFWRASQLLMETISFDRLATNIRIIDEILEQQDIDVSIIYCIFMIFAAHLSFRCQLRNSKISLSMRVLIPQELLGT